MPLSLTFYLLVTVVQLWSVSCVKKLYVTASMILNKTRMLPMINLIEILYLSVTSHFQLIVLEKVTYFFFYYHEMHLRGILPFPRHTPFHTFFPLIEAVLEVFFGEGL